MWLRPVVTKIKKTRRVNNQEDYIMFDKVRIYVLSYFWVGNLKLNKNFSMNYYIKPSLQHKDSSYFDLLKSVLVYNTKEFYIW